MLAQIKGQVLIGAGLVFLTLCPFLLIFNAETIAEKVAIGAYVFLVVGVIQQIHEEIS